jgi:hypothetical protein
MNSAPVAPTAPQLCLYYDPSCGDSSRGCDLATSCIMFANDTVRSKMFEDEGNMRVCLLTGDLDTVQVLGRAGDDAAVCSINAQGFAPVDAAMMDANETLCGIGSVPIMTESGKIMCMQHFTPVDAATTAAPAPTTSTMTATTATTPASTTPAAPASTAASTTPAAPAAPATSTSPAAPAAPAASTTPAAPAAPAAPVAPMAPASTAASEMAAPAISEPVPSLNEFIATKREAEAERRRQMTTDYIAREQARMMASLAEADARREAERLRLAEDAGLSVSSSSMAAQPMNGDAMAPMTLAQFMGRKPAMRPDMPSRDQVRYPPFGRSSDSIEDRLRMTQYGLATVATSGLV